MKKINESYKNFQKEPTALEVVQAVFDDNDYSQRLALKARVFAAVKDPDAASTLANIQRAGLNPRIQMAVGRHCGDQCRLFPVKGGAGSRRGLDLRCGDGGAAGAMTFMELKTLFVENRVREDDKIGGTVDGARVGGGLGTVTGVAVHTDGTVMILFSGTPELARSIEGEADTYRRRAEEATRSGQAKRKQALADARKEMRLAAGRPETGSALVSPRFYAEWKRAADAGDEKAETEVLVKAAREYRARTGSWPYWINYLEPGVSHEGREYTKRQIQEAIDYWKKQLEAGNYRKMNEAFEHLPGNPYDIDNVEASGWAAFFVRNGEPAMAIDFQAVLPNLPRGAVDVEINLAGRGGVSTAGTLFLKRSDAMTALSQTELDQQGGATSNYLYDGLVNAGMLTNDLADEFQTSDVEILETFVCGNGTVIFGRDALDDNADEWDNDNRRL